MNLNLNLKLDEFAGNTNIVHRFDLDESEDGIRYDMIIGRDLLNEFGKIRYTCLPMGMVISGDIFQAKVYDLIGDIEGVHMYIDDILCIGKGTIQEHLDQLEESFWRFSKAGLKVNAPKCSFGLKEIPYLGYIISMDGLKHDPKKVQGILDLQPTTAKEMKSLIGMIQFYQDMCQRRSHILSPLIDSALGKKGNMMITWTPASMDEAFVQMQAMISDTIFLSYPDWNIPFDVHADASDKQLGAVISQLGTSILQSPTIKITM